MVDVASTNNPEVEQQMTTPAEDFWIQFICGVVIVAFYVWFFAVETPRIFRTNSAIAVAETMPCNTLFEITESSQDSGTGKTGYTRSVYFLVGDKKALAAEDASQFVWDPSIEPGHIKLVDRRHRIYHWWPWPKE